MKTVTLNTIRNGQTYWLAQITWTEDGMLAGVTDYGNFAHSWRAFGTDFEAFLLDIDEDYLASKLESDLLYFGLGRRQASSRASTLASMILLPLQDAIRKERTAP